MAEASGQADPDAWNHLLANPAGFEWRNGLIFKARRKGRTVATIAKQHGISGPRVSQIIKDYERNHGG